MVPAHFFTLLNTTISPEGKDSRKRTTAWDSDSFQFSWLPEPRSLEARFRVFTVPGLRPIRTPAARCRTTKTQLPAPFSTTPANSFNILDPTGNGFKYYEIR